MNISRTEIDLFFKLFYQLLLYVNKKLNIIKGIDSIKDFPKFPMEQLISIRDELFKNIEIMDLFLNENHLNFSGSELEIIRNWKNFVKGKFFVFRYLKNYTVFLDTEEPAKAYGVLSLNSTFEELLGPYLPVMADAVLLPFRDKIIYDGFLASYPVSFGSGTRRRINDNYQEAKSGYGIITSLPFIKENVVQNSSENLKFYLKSEHNREMYWLEIAELLESEPDLLTLYHQEMGRIHARKYRKRLSEIGFFDLWFAVFEGIIIASGKTKEQAEKNLNDIIPEEKKDFCFLFHLKKEVDYK